MEETRPERMEKRGGEEGMEDVQWRSEPPDRREGHRSAWRTGGWRGGRVTEVLGGEEAGEEGREPEWLEKAIWELTPFSRPSHIHVAGLRTHHTKLHPWRRTTKRDAVL
jgi:hypothetical protein